jgi:hypothetical protein
VFYRTYLSAKYVVDFAQRCAYKPNLEVLMSEATDEVRKFLRAAGSKGGKTRAERHSEAELSKWASKGGWPKGRPRGKRKKEAAERQKAR